MREFTNFRLNYEIWPLKFSDVKKIISNSLDNARIIRKFGG